jgi:capsular exopolysaccharide synthesis family protein
MNNLDNKDTIPQVFEETLNIREELEKYSRQWKWFVVSALFFLIGTYLFLRYQPSIYETSATLLIKEDQSSMSSELAAFQDLASIGGGADIIDNEIQILKSRTLAETVVDDLNLWISYFEEGSVIESEVFQGVLELKPIRVIGKKRDTLFYIKYVGDNRIELLDKNKKFIAKQKTNQDLLIAGDTYQIIQDSSFVFSKEVITQIKVVIGSKEDAVNSLMNLLKVSTVDKNSSVLLLSIQHTLKSKGITLLRQLLHNYEKQEINDKSEVSQNTAFFVGERVKIIRAELSQIDRLVEQYKNDNNLTNIEKESEAFIRSSSRSSQALFDANTQLKLLEFMNVYLQKDKGSFGLIPALGFQDVSINNLTGQYNKVVLERSRVLRNSTANNPLVLNYQDQLGNLRGSLEESLENLNTSLNITIKELSRNDNKLNSKKASLPRKEREFRDLVRQQGIKESLYLYLLQKQEETQISLAVTTSNSRIVDQAYSSRTPVAPKKKIILFAGLLLGLLVPFIIIYIRDVLDNKFHSRQELEAIVSAPILGDIPIKETKANIVVSKGSRTSTAEAFRLLRTNLDFMLASKQGSKNTIFLTSTTSGEGKSFVSINLAFTLALSGKKVALLGMDLRAPKLTEYLGLPNRKGITNYILDDNLTIEDIKFSVKEHENVDFFASGIIPPNPAELLLHPRVDELFTKVKEAYDYVIVDTAPVNLVTDTLVLSHRADLFIYVVRANYLDKRLLAVPQNLYQEKRLPNIAMLINGSDHVKGYGYGAYGAYGYGQQVTKPWWKTIIKG